MKPYRKSESLAFVNHSQLEDLKKSELDRWAKRTGCRLKETPGIRIPLGHTYSIILEKLAEEGIYIEPNSRAFLEFVKTESRQRVSVDRTLSLGRPSFEFAYGPAIYQFMIVNGMSLRGSYQVMKELYGFVDDAYHPDVSQRFFEKSIFFKREIS